MEEGRKVTQVLIRLNMCSGTKANSCFMLEQLY